MYRGHGFRQNIRPEKIKTGIDISKNRLRNPLYADVWFYNEWENIIECNPDLWNSLVQDVAEHGQNLEVKNTDAGKKKKKKNILVELKQKKR